MASSGGASGGGVTDHGALGGLADDDHALYALDADRGAANGYGSLDAGAKVPTAQLGTGTADASTFLRGDRSWAAGGGGVTDHGALTGLADDDHAQYALDTALTVHEADTTSVHGIADTSALYRAGGTDVAVADGGTGSSTAAGARAALDVPSTSEAVLDTLVDAAGDLIKGTGADVVARFARGANGEFLRATSTDLAYARSSDVHHYSDGKTIADTVAATSMLDSTTTLLGGVVGETLSFAISGHVFNNSGSATGRTVEFRLTVGSAAVCLYVTGTFVAHATNTWPFVFTGVLSVREVSAIGSVIAKMHVLFPLAGGSVGDTISAVKSGVDAGVGGEDTTTAVNVGATVVLGTAHADFQVVVADALIVRAPRWV